MSNSISFSQASLFRTDKGRINKRTGVFSEALCDRPRPCLFMRLSISSCSVPARVFVHPLGTKRLAKRIVWFLNRSARRTKSNQRGEASTLRNSTHDRSFSLIFALFTDWTRLSIRKYRDWNIAKYIYIDSLGYSLDRCRN